MTTVSDIAMAETRLLYVYGLVGETVPVGWEATGLTEETTATVRNVPGTGLRALVQTVDREVWTGPESDERLQNIEWVGPRACRHEALVEQLDEQGAVFPMRFATLFSGPEALADRIQDQRAPIVEYLRAADVHREWSVKGLLDRDRANRALTSGARDAAASTSGADYLKRRAEQQSAGDRVAEWLEEVAPPIYEAFGAIADAAAVRTGVEAPDDEAETAFHWAFWVHDDRLEAWTGVRDQLPSTLREHGLELAIEGPWPGYSFRPSFDAAG